MEHFFKIIIFVYFLVIFNKDVQSNKLVSSDVDVFAKTSSCRKMDRIMNGAVANEDMFPYLVSIQSSSAGQHLCGGTLLSPSHILTAAHCMFIKTMDKQFAAKDLQVRIGPSNLRLPAKIVAKVIWFKIHDQYKQKPIDNDIAVLKVDKTLTTSKAHIPCLSNSYIKPSTVSGPCIAVGWGRLGPDPSTIDSKTLINNSLTSNHTINSTISYQNISINVYNETHNYSIAINASVNNQNSSTSNISLPGFVTPNNTFVNLTSTGNDSIVENNRTDDVRGGRNNVPREIILRFTLLPLQDIEECAKDYSFAGITADVICAGRRKSETDTCKGDSGGPLICDDKIEGIVSFGDGCENPNHLGVYTRVYNHLGWIQKQIKSGTISYQYNSIIMPFIFINILFYIKTF